MLWAIIKSILEIKEQNRIAEQSTVSGVAYDFTLVKKNLKCPFCNSKVYDNQDSKYNAAAPDFVCSNNNPDESEGHTGKYRKGWWIDDFNLPNEWFRKK